MEEEKKQEDFKKQEAVQENQEAAKQDEQKKAQEAQKAVKPEQKEEKKEAQAEAPKKSDNTYGDIQAIPVIDAVEGIKYDFNSGLRVYFPETDKKYHLKFDDADSGLVRLPESGKEQGVDA